MTVLELDERDDQGADGDLRADERREQPGVERLRLSPGNSAAR